MNGIIYCLTSPSSKKYIGQCTNFKRRMRRYKCKDCKKQPKIYRALCKYGFENFKIEIIEVVDISLLNEKEKFYILKYDTMINGYNCTTGGGSPFFSKETKNKMSNSHIGSKNHFFGKTHTLETRKILSENGKKQLGKLNPFFGKTHTSETREKIRKSKIGTHLTEEVKKKLSFASKGDKSSFAKSYKIISPIGELYIIKGTLKSFIRAYSLSLDCVKKFMDKGIIPPPKNPQHNRVISFRRNTTAWSFSRII